MATEALLPVPVSKEEPSSFAYRACLGQAAWSWPASATRRAPPSSAVIRDRRMICGARLRSPGRTPPRDSPVSVTEQEGDFVDALAGKQRARRPCAGTSASTGAFRAGPRQVPLRRRLRGGSGTSGLHLRRGHVAARRPEPARRCAVAAAGRCRPRTRSFSRGVPRAAPVAGEHERQFSRDRHRPC